MVARPTLRPPLLALAAVLAALPAPLAAREAPAFCAGLASAELAALVGGSTEVPGSGPHDIDGRRVYACRYGDLFGAHLIVNIGSGATGRGDPAAQVAEYVALFRLTEGEGYLLDRLEGLGDAAIWDPQVQMLVAWLHGGGVEVNLTGEGLDDPDAVTKAARLILPLLPEALP